jgi:hypothetical protein
MEVTMKKLILVLLVLALGCGSAFAFDILSYPSSMAGGDLQVDIGVGYALGSAGGWKLKIPPLAVSVDYALPVEVPISVGGIFGFYQYGYDSGVWDYTHTYMVFGGRANWHWGFDVKWLDLYTGLTLGYRYHRSSIDGPNSNLASDTSYSGFSFGGQLGAHFYFTKTVGAVVEFGYPFVAKVGLALKF